MTALEWNILLDAMWYIVLVGGFLSVAWLIFDAWIRGGK